MKTVTVTFDSNVWEKIVDEKKRLETDDYPQLFNLIKEGYIRPFFFEGIINLEVIEKKNRKKYIGEYEPTIITQINNEEPQVDVGTNAPKITPYLEKTIPEALNLGFKFIMFARVGAHSNVDDKDKALDKFYSMSERQARTSGCYWFIEELGAGMAKLKNDLGGKDEEGIVEQTRKNATLTDKKYADGIGEWVDGDALSAHYGYGFDYFCTNDRARNAGGASVFSAENRKELSTKFGIKIVSPDELIKLFD